MAAFAVVGLVLLRLSRRRDAVPVISELGDELGRIGFAVAAALIAVTIPVQIFLSVAQVLASLQPGGAAARLSFDITPVVTLVVDPSRVLVGVVLLIFAVRAARRGQAGRALVMGCVGVMLVALARQLLFGYRTPAPINRDALNLLASGVVIVTIAILLARRRLTAQRALAFAGLLILSALFSYRDFISDPLGRCARLLGRGVSAVWSDLGSLYRLQLGKWPQPPISASHTGVAGLDQLRAEHDRPRVRGARPRRQHHDLLRSLCSARGLDLGHRTDRGCRGGDLRLGHGVIERSHD